MVEQRREEAFACEVLRRALGATFTAFDDNTMPRQVDGLFTLPSGVEGALEVTTIGDEAALAVESLAHRRDWTVPGAQWSWLVHVGATVSMDELRAHLDDVVLTCESLGARSPDEVSHESRVPSFEWFARSAITMRGFPSSNRPGTIEVLPEGGGGAVHQHLDELPGWLHGMLARPGIASKVDKLRTTGRAELHLFVRVHDTGMPFSLYHPLAFDDVVPSGTLEAPGGLTGLWLAPRWRNPILRWGAEVGWQREDVLD